jgi:hypothetical protein
MSNVGVAFGDEPHAISTNQYIFSAFLIRLLRDMMLRSWRQRDMADPRLCNATQYNATSDREMDAAESSYPVRFGGLNISVPHSYWVEERMLCWWS